MLQLMRHGRAFVRESWRCAIERTAIYTVIDATAGRGSDTITLGQLVGSQGVVYALDIQSAAVDETKQRYNSEIDRARSTNSGMGKLELHCASHANFSFLGLLRQSVSCIVYNLGWYPGRDADRSIITRTKTTLSSLQSAQDLVVVHGIICVTAYLGHPGGAEEAEAVLAWARKLPKREWNVVHIAYPNRETAPTMLICERLA